MVACASLDCSSILERIRCDLMDLRRSFRMSAIEELRFTSQAYMECRRWCTIYGHNSFLESEDAGALVSGLKRIVMTVSPGLLNVSKEIISFGSGGERRQPGIRHVLRAAHCVEGYDVINLSGTSLRSVNLGQLGHFECQSRWSTSKGFKIDLSNNGLDERCVDSLVAFLRRNAANIVEINVAGNYFAAEDIEKMLAVTGLRQDALIHEGQKRERLRLIIKGDVLEVHFVVHKGRRMFKVFDAYCRRVVVPLDKVRFFWGGRRIDPNMTAQDVDMEDGDIIYAMTEQLGD